MFANGVYMIPICKQIMKREDYKKFDLTSLETFQLETVDVAVILDIRRSKDTGNYPVKYRVTYNRKVVYYPCMDITMDEYSRLHGQIRDNNLKKTKKIILDGFTRIRDLIIELTNKEGYTHEALARRLKRGTVDSLFDWFDNKVTELNEAGKIGSMDWYRCAKKSVERYANKELKFSDITPTFLKGYESHLLKEGKEYTTISINMRALRAIINAGMAQGVISPAQYPFNNGHNGKYRIPEGKGRKIALSTEQLMKVFNYKLNPEDEQWRDLWVFSFYCNGANIGDILQLKYENITGEYLEFYRKKTISQDREKTKIRVFITKEMHTIILRYGNKDKKTTNYIFPYITHGLTPIEERKIVQNTLHSINKRMKAIGQALKYGDITTYWARHSWASISRHQGVSTFAISKGMGHKNLTTTQIYLDSLSDDELIKNSNLLPRRNSTKSKRNKTAKS